MEKLYTKAYGKVNLTLNILHKREDGYHNLESVFQRISLYDELYIEKNNLNTLVLHCNISSLETEKNLIWKAYQKLREKFKTISGVTVTLTKHIPMEAGLGGGSADCAHFILAMNTLFSLHMSTEELIHFGMQLGADVPSCLFKGCIKGEGIGEKITPIHTHMKYYMVIIKPTFSCSTKEMFEKLDEKNVLQKDCTEVVIHALETSNLNSLTSNLYNAFEEVLFDKIDVMKNDLKHCGALNSLLAGSGSCVFGIFENKKRAKEAYLHLKTKYETYFAFSYNQ